MIFLGFVEKFRGQLQMGLKKNEWFSRHLGSLHLRSSVRGGLLARISLLGLTGLGLVACGGAQFPKVQTLGGLRVIGIQASQPEVNANSLPAVVNLTALISDLGSGGRAVSLTVQACPDPGVSFGAIPSCAGVVGAVDVASTTINPVPVANNSQTFGTPSLTGAVPAVSVTVPAGLLTGRSPIDQYNGVGYLVTFQLQAGAEVVSAYKRIRVSTRTTPNTNPDVTAVLADGVALSALPSVPVQLSVLSNVTASIDYLDQQGSLKIRDKNFSVSYFSSDGEIQRGKVGRSDTNKWTPPSAAPLGRPTTIVAVIYDGEGGMDYLIVDF